MAKILDSTTLPCGLRTLDVDGLNQVAQELREELIESVAKSGGHFASSLGALELTVALHHMFETPEDRIIWDVGHQAYVHKMLTGRRNELGSIRKKDGVSGFLKRCESEYDCFGAGHAGTSISAAVGMAIAARKSGSNRKVVAVIGDGSMTAGMAFEALNHAGAMGLDNLIVVLNDNEMSISPNVGAISWLFSRTVTSSLSTRARSGFKELYRKGYVPEVMYKAIDRAEEMAQSFIASSSMLFEAFGFRYIGPVDGHNIEDLLKALGNAKTQDVPVVVHVSTVKGKGYEPAEEDPVKWHGVTPFDKTRGQFLAAQSAANKAPSYTSVFAGTLIELSKSDPSIVGITAAMPGGTGLDEFQKHCPDAFYDVGICEQHAVTFAAGMACEGYKPVCAIYSTFLQRAYDQVLHDVCIQNLPVVFAMDRGGVVGNDGETHQGVFDIAYLRTIPNIVLMSPADENELRHMLYTACQHNGPVGLRYPRGNGSGVEIEADMRCLEIGKGNIVRQGSDALLICFGPIIAYASQAADRLMNEHGITCTIINARYAKPLDEELLAREIPKYPFVCTLEDHALSGGFGSAVLELINDSAIAMQGELHRFGVNDEFVPHASQLEQHQANNYDPESIFRVIARHCLPKLLSAVG